MVCIIHPNKDNNFYIVRIVDMESFDKWTSFDYEHIFYMGCDAYSYMFFFDPSDPAYIRNNY